MVNDLEKRWVKDHIGRRERILREDLSNQGNK